MKLNKAEKVQAEVLGIVTHPNPHLDEIVAMWLLYYFGEKSFPGIREIIDSGKITFHREESLPPNIKAKPGQYIFLGVCRSVESSYVFDEHPGKGLERIEGQTCSSLVAKFLGVNNLPELNILLKEVSRIDLSGGAEILSLASHVKNAYSCGLTFSAIRATAFEMLNVHYMTQRSFHQAASEMDKGNTFNMEIGGASRKILIITSPNKQVSAYARSEYGGLYDIVVVQDPHSGHVFISSRNPSKMERREGKTAVNLTDLLRVLRCQEAFKRKIDLPEDPEAISSEEGISGIPWRSLGAGMIMNGSHTAPDVPATKIPLGDFKGLIQIALSEDLFPSDRESECRAGVCTHKTLNPCPIYLGFLSRCQKIRRRGQDNGDNYIV